MQREQANRRDDAGRARTLRAGARLRRCFAKSADHAASVPLCGGESAGVLPGWLRVLVGSRAADRAVSSSSARSSSWIFRSRACCSRSRMRAWRPSMSVGAPIPVRCQTCWPSSALRRCSSTRTWSDSRRQRSFAARRSACSEALLGAVAPPAGPASPRGGLGLAGPGAGRGRFLLSSHGRRRSGRSRRLRGGRWAKRAGSEIPGHSSMGTRIMMSLFGLTACRRRHRRCC